MESKDKILQKFTLAGFLIGALIGFLVILISSGNLPFTESNTMGLGDIGSLIDVFYLYATVAGATIGFMIGFTLGLVFQLKNK
ncbi:MAG: hypothetical protein ACR2MD_17315 [Aridibacter sp.]|jgi:hypothetical protein